MNNKAENDKVQINTRRRKVILSAGKLGASNNSFAVSSNEGLNPICGKPSIYWNLKSVKDLSNAQIVISKDNTRLAEYLAYLYPELTCKKITSKNILESLYFSIEEIDCDSEIVIILGDTYVEEDLNEIPADTLLVNSNVKDSSRWCLVDYSADGSILEFFDKCNSKDKDALIGVYVLSSSKLLKDCVKAALEAGKTNLSDAFSLYMQTRSLKVKECSTWVDMGHVNGAVEARKKFISDSAREFNSIKIIESLGILEKTSTHIDKLDDEQHWYKSLPEEISFICPRVLNFERNEKFAKITMELYGYSNLSEMLLYGGAMYEEWTRIVDSLFEIRSVMDKHLGEDLSSADLSKIYVEKNFSRLADLEKDENFKELLIAPKITINSKTYDNLPNLIDFIKQSISDLLLKPLKSCVTHGDYCLSNILFDANHYIFRFIDPRGRFSKRGVYGDSRYDVAKLRHSIVGHYDFMVAGLFKIIETEKNTFEFKLHSLPFLEKLGEYFDNTLQKNGYSLKEIKLIEALLFLSMIPLHNDVPTRQLAFYLTSIKKFNELKEL